ncbi:MAG: cell filamentation protein Fic [Alphaproteobacteria bacterium 41-28]|nr:MAG: cell filamentation protein Fic [Alphaproteobacteria bacterium 41-28]
MAKPSEKLAQSLKILRELQSQGGIVIRSSALSRTHRQRLLSNGFIREVLKGWYIPTRPDETAGESTGWYASYWDFCSGYLKSRFGTSWCISPEQSLSLHASNKTIPKQLIIHSPKAGNNVTPLLYETSLLDMRANMPKDNDIEELADIRVFSIPAALVACSQNYFNQYPAEVRSVLASLTEASHILELLLEGGHSKVAGRLAGAFRNIGRDKIADDILATMRAAGYDVREEDPFSKLMPEFSLRKDSHPAITRLCLMWQEMRHPILGNFPKGKYKIKALNETLQQIEDIYVRDAYHSLSIEGYRVSPELIERVSKGVWDPDENEKDREYKDALAARGYWQAFQAVKMSLKKILEGENPGSVAENDHGIWYRELFAPSVIAGILRLSHLAGYRNDQVFIRHSRHVPPSRETVRELMPTFFNLLKDEPSHEVRIVLGHFLFVYIHPYMDGNGRIARFLMNLMLATGGYPWTIIPIQDRAIYFEALEEASVQQNIIPFTQFLAKCMVSEDNQFK